jgi:hypothetical protein
LGLTEVGFHEKGVSKIGSSDISVAKVGTDKVFPPFERSTSQILTGEVQTHVVDARSCGTLVDKGIP